MRLVAINLKLNAAKQNKVRKLAGMNFIHSFTHFIQLFNKYLTVF